MAFQLPLFLIEQDSSKNQTHLVRQSFSHGNICAQQERIALENRYRLLFEETEEFNRKSVSYQGNKGEIVHSWNSNYLQGLAVYLLENGDLLRSDLPYLNPTFFCGGIT